MILSNFQPRRREISAVTNAAQAVITTSTDHLYDVGLFVRIFIPSDYGMNVEYQRAEVVEVPASNQVTVDLDTSALSAFSVPTAPPSFTTAHMVPITGTTDNATSI